MEYITSDLGIASYLKINDIKLIKLKQDKKDKRRIVFLFDNENQIAEKKAIEFANSEFKDYDSNLRMLKLMAMEELERNKNNG